MAEVLFDMLFLGDERKGSETADLVRPLLAPDEDVLHATKGMRDGAAFTTKRIMVVNKQGITGKKIEFTSIPLRSISAFTIENSGTFDLDAELTIYGSGFGKAKMQFTKGFDVAKLGQYLAEAL
jgi:Bacterial PH domain